MSTFAERCVLAVLGYAALTNYQALVADANEVRQELRQERGGRTERLVSQWQEIRPNAEVAAQFYKIDMTVARRGRRRANHEQQQFFEEQLFASVNFWRIAGEDIAAGRVDAGTLSAYLGADARAWLALLQQQEGRWDEARAAQIALAIKGLELLVYQEQRHQII
ncbi:MAG TPA: hypothetical protein VG841_13930 [Caulobacterales bacterium]|nr:hypothetical protein [Caulobacterales bacterium]